MKKDGGPAFYKAYWKEFNFDFAVATTMLCDKVEYDTACIIVRKEMKEDTLLAELAKEE